MRAWIIIVVAMVSAVFGFCVAAALSTGKIADLYAEVAQLEETLDRNGIY